MHAALKRIHFELLFAVGVLILIPIFLLLTYINVTIDIFRKGPKEIDKMSRKHVYGE
jgi:hypothetical protein